jgi:hypothetical protein
MRNARYTLLAVAAKALDNPPASHSVARQPHASVQRFEFMAASGASAPSARQVTFSIFTGDTKLVDGNLTVMDSRGVSCFETSSDMTIVGRKDRAAIFQGAIFEHELNADGSVFVSVRYYTTEPIQNHPVGFRQIVAVSKELTMGSESGNGKLESVRLGDAYELVFRSRSVA